MNNMFSSNAELEIEVLDTRETVGEFLPHWKKLLQSHRCEYDVYSDPDYVYARLETDLSLQPSIAVLRKNRTIYAIAPFYITTERIGLQCSVWRLGARNTRVVRLFGEQIIIFEEISPKFLLAIINDWMLKNRSLYDMVAFEMLPTVSFFYRELDELLRHTSHMKWYLAAPQAEIRHQIELPESYDCYLASLGYETRRGLRRKSRKLHQIGDVKLRCVTSPDDVPYFLYTVDEIYRESWQSKTFGFSSRSTCQHKDFYTKLANANLFRSYLLTSNAEPLAYCVGLQNNNYFQLEDIAFVQHKADYSPGTVLISLIIEDLYRHRTPKLIDFGRGDAEYKRRLSNKTIETVALWLVPPGRWRWLARSQQALFAMERCCRWILIALKLDRIVRRVVKRQC